METTADELDLLVEQARRAGAACRAHRAALGRNALVWWTGEAAERYWVQVERRRAALAARADDLEVLASGAAVLARLLRLEVGALRDLGVRT
jgi:hypothetical protein